MVEKLSDVFSILVFSLNSDRFSSVSNLSQVDQWTRGAGRDPVPHSKSNVEYSPDFQLYSRLVKFKNKNNPFGFRELLPVSKEYFRFKIFQNFIKNSNLSSKHFRGLKIVILNGTFGFE